MNQRKSDLALSEARCDRKSKLKIYTIAPEKFSINFFQLDKEQLKSIVGGTISESLTITKGDR